MVNNIEKIDDEVDINQEENIKKRRDYIARNSFLTGNLQEANRLLYQRGQDELIPLKQRVGPFIKGPMDTHIIKKIRKQRANGKTFEVETYQDE